MESQTRRPPASRRALSVTTALAFLAMGLSNAVIGPSLPWMAEHWRVALDATGILIALLFFGSCAAIALSGFLVDRIGRKPLLIAGLVLGGVGLAILAAADGLGTAEVGAAVIGLGWGCLEATINVFVADLFPEARSAALNIMNLFYGIGSLLAPLAIGAILGVGLVPGLVIAVVSGVSLLIGLGYVLLGFPAPPGHADGPLMSPRVMGRVLRDGYVLALALMLFVYVGLEAGFGGWASSLAIAGAHFDLSTAALVPATYWITFTLARLGAGLIARYVDGARMVLGGALIAATGAAILTLFNGVPAAFFVGAAILGIGFAPIFPTAFGLAAGRYATMAGIMSSFVVLGGSLGGAVLPYVLGWVLTHGGVAATTGLLVAMSLFVAGMQLALSRAARRPARAAVASPSEVQPAA